MPSFFSRRFLSSTIALLPVLLATVPGCSDDTTSPTSGGSFESAKPVVEQYALNVHANYAECLAKAKLLQTAINAFVATPSSASMEAAKQAWIAARVPYGPSEVYRFYNGPIDDESTGPEGAINAWPLDESYIDYTRDSATAGLINHPDLVAQITKEDVRAKNEEGGETNISTGYHAIEFLLWGQDSEQPELKTPGNRPYTDYVVSGGTASNQDRRGQYLKIVTDMLVEDLDAMVSAWEPNKENYAKTFIADAKGGVTKMLTGMGSLANAELSGERMTVAYKNKGQEDEHSCFSDNTDADLLGNFLGIQNVYLGRYGSSAGAGLDQLVAAVDPALDTQFKGELDAAVSALTAMQSTPFDAAIAADDASPERQNVLKAIQAIKKTATTIVTIGQKLGVEFQLEEPSEQL